MHQLKVALLVVLVLAVMRLSSWSLLWLLGRAFRSGSVRLRLAANVMALLAFAAFLVADSVPGELLDLQALAFGAVVFGLFFAVDARWLPRVLLPASKQ
jgi:hypothetical protein